MLQVKPVILSGNWVQLEPLSEDHRDGLKSIAEDERIWTYLPHHPVGEKFNQWFDKTIASLATGSQLPFAVRRMVDKKIIGTTRYYDIYPEHHRLAIGYTWYMPDAWGTYVNPECKYLLLKHAFENLAVNRVELYTDFRNSRSRSAIKKLGALEEGILRKHMVLENGYVRDTVIFSIITADWLTVKNNLHARLNDLREK